MKDERAALDEKIQALTRFINGSDIFPTLARVDQALMRVQLDAMRAYITALDTRIDRAQRRADREAIFRG